MAFSWFTQGTDPAVGGAVDPAAGGAPGPNGGRPLEAVVFDWGGTLTPFHDVDLLDLWRMAAIEISPAHADEITAILAGLESAWWRGREGADGLSGNGAQDGMTGSVTELLAEASARLGVDVAAAVLQAATRRDLAAWTPHTMCDPEALLLVHLVRARGLLVGLLTNTRWPRLWHERLLERDGLLGLFHARVYTSDLPFDKPHPIAFQAVLDALGLVDPSRVLFVGDRVQTDIRGARAAGMRTVLVADGRAGPGPGGLGPGRTDLAGPARPNPLADPIPRDDGGRARGQRPVAADAVIARLGQLLDVLDAFGAARPGTPPPR
ncbi:HAD family hydrolase [Parafrankia sp. EUN1f]|uniref:HAD family hydrolase n=1 Tax=Parafrankia sp. EUN1f TaxID=102897 RepID=UPI0001C47577|nr:HAD family hydrolase [Parafrankia sp. EUN1f]EFC79278.1 HAD-superfamily hydrolase, subfamily IA, variant 3 [Parafrankia sp. EUN1f]